MSDRFKAVALAIGVGVVAAAGTYVSRSSQSRTARAMSRYELAPTASADEPRVLPASFTEATRTGVSDSRRNAVGNGLSTEYVPLRTTFKHDFVDPIDGKTYNIDLGFDSTVDRADDQFRYAYSFANKGTRDVRLEWTALEESEEVQDAARHAGKSLYERGYAKVGFHHPLVPIVSGQSPRIAYSPVRVYVRRGGEFDSLIATALVGSYIPSPHAK